MTVAFYVASLKKSVTLQINWEGLLASDEIVLKWHGSHEFFFVERRVDRFYDGILGH